MFPNRLNRIPLVLTFILVMGMLLASSAVAVPHASKLIASDGAAWDQFGYSVAASGDAFVVGAPLDDAAGANSGAAYVYAPNGAGGYVEAKLTASDGAASYFFGASVAVSGDTIAVGASKDSDGGSWSGAAYVYRPDGAGGYTETKLVASDAAAENHFGVAVAVSGDTVVVGALYGDDELLTDTGAVYVYTPNGTGGYTETKLNASDAARWDAFGNSVAVSGGTIVVGASGRSDAGSGSGAAYVFESTGSGTYSETKLAASDAVTSARFGASVAVSDGRIVVGAPSDNAAGANSGAAYMYAPNGAGGYTETKLTASDAAVQDRFGVSVSVAGGTVVVGAEAPYSGVDSSGSAYVFAPDGAGGYLETKLTALDAVLGDRFGFSVATVGGTVVVGAPGYGDPDLRDLPGSAYVFSIAEAATSAVVDDLEVLLDSGTDADKEIGDAVENAQKALDKLGDGKTGAALGKLAKAVKDLEDALEADPSLDLAEAITTLTAAARTAAVSDVDQARVIDPGSNRVAQADELLAEGDALRDAGDYSAAIGKYKKAANKVNGLLP